MKMHLAIVAALLSVLLVSQVAYAGMEEVILKDGTSHKAEVAGTTWDSITVKKSRGDASSELKLEAARMDPHNFYHIRSKYMEDTAENHLRLAVICFATGLFDRGKSQLATAEKMDPALVEKVKEEHGPAIRSGIAKQLLKDAKYFYNRGELQKAKELCSEVATKLDDTPEAETAQFYIMKLDELMVEREAAAEAKRLQKLDDDAKRADAELKKKLDPIEKGINRGADLNQQGLMQKNQGQAKKHYEAAASAYISAAKRAESDLKKFEGNDEAIGTLNGLLKEAKDGAIQSFINAGNVAMGRRSFNEAQRYASHALAVDQNDTKAQAFQKQVTTNASMGGGWGRWR